MIEAAVTYFALIFARVSLFVAVLPFAGGRNVPRLVKAGLAVALTAMWFGSAMEALPLGSLLQWTEPVSWIAIALALGREAIIGAILGFAFGLVLVPARIAGEYLTQEMGLSFGNQVNSFGDGMEGPLTMIFEMVAAMIFFGLDGHHVFFATLHGSFAQYPVGESLAWPGQNLIALATTAEEWGLLLAGPVALCLLLTTVALTLMARAVPQLNLYSIGFPLRLGVGLAALLILFPSFVATLVSLCGRAGEFMARLV